MTNLTTASRVGETRNSPHPHSFGGTALLLARISPPRKPPTRPPAPQPTGRPSAPRRREQRRDGETRPNCCRGTSSGIAAWGKQQGVRRSGEGGGGGGDQGRSGGCAAPAKRPKKDAWDTKSSLLPQPCGGQERQLVHNATCRASSDELTLRSTSGVYSKKRELLFFMSKLSTSPLPKS